ncbi:hypothetical protein M407DRAFT_28187 [Tulasnella calospora MUT 4182]|uniref:Uncharacterized protein n=1 Tax=Tulasnella calospora MUT 4182 TaxID=1051891 RepID=A0A0C3QCK0_9AGAM|nr:hypothetical protein M407DRAFT_28187 [Tulasnella calospora MUT 4182]
MNRLQSRYRNSRCLSLNLDKRIIDHMVKQYKKKTDTDASKDDHALGKLNREVEKAKRVSSCVNA